MLICDFFRFCLDFVSFTNKQECSCFGVPNKRPAPIVCMYT